jgi:hypothetical protein
MRTAAQLLHGRDSDWIDELEQLAEEIDGISPSAKAALRATVESFRQEPDATDAARAARLLDGA